jgi:hypothetical protein
MVLGSPALGETDADQTVIGELVNRFVAEVDGLSEQIGKVVIVEDLDGVTGQYLEDGVVVEVVRHVAVATLHKDRTVGQALGVHLSAHVVQMHSFADVSSCVLDGRVAVHVAQQSETEAVRIVGRIGESVDDDAAALSVKRLADTDAELVIRHGTPMFRLLEVDRRQIIVRCGA